MTAFPRALAINLFIVGLAGCGGNTIGNDAASPPTADTEVLLPYVTAAGELKLLDPSSPGSVAVTVDSGLSASSVATAMRRIPDGDYGTGNEVSNAHFRHVAYVKGGQLWRSDLLKGADHTPVRFSSVGDACSLLGYTSNYANPLDRWLFVARKGSDNSCADPNDTTFVKLSAGTGTGGVTPGPGFVILTTFLNADGSAAGHLVQHGAPSAPVLQVYDDNFSARPGTVALEPVTWAQSGDAQSRTQRYLRLRQDNVDASDKLYRYDASTGQIAALYTFAVTGAGLVADGDDTYLYFVDENEIWRVPHGGTTLERLATRDPALTVRGLHRSASRLIVRVQNGLSGEMALYSLPQGPVTSPGQVLELQAPTSSSIDVEAIAGGRIFYSVGTSAVLVGEGGAGRVSTAGQWAGLLFNPSFDAGGLNKSLIVRQLVLRRTDGSFAAFGASGGGTELGTVAGADDAAGFNVGRYLLVDVGIGANTDVYFADAQAAGSMLGVATDPADDAAP